MAYVPQQPPASYDAMYLLEELMRIQQDLQNPSVVTEVFAEPARVHGKMVLADGTQWNPGSGRGVYVWDDVSGVWRFLG